MAKKRKKQKEHFVATLYFPNSSFTFKVVFCLFYFLLLRLLVSLFNLIIQSLWHIAFYVTASL